MKLHHILPLVGIALCATPACAVLTEGTPSAPTEEVRKPAARTIIQGHKRVKSDAAALQTTVLPVPPHNILPALPHASKVVEAQ